MSNAGNLPTLEAVVSMFRLMEEMKARSGKAVGRDPEGRVTGAVVAVLQGPQAEELLEAYRALEAKWDAEAAASGLDVLTKTMEGGPVDA